MKAGPLFQKLLRIGQQTQDAQLPDPPRPDVNLYVVGDVHGRFDLLTSLMKKIDIDKSEQSTNDAAVVFVGDLIDRGGQSAEVLKLVREYIRSDVRNACVMGNHERMMLDFLDRPKENAPWLTFGGAETLASFGLDTSENAVDLSTVRDEFRRAMPDGLENWLRGLPLIWQNGNVAVVHGAADPNRAIDAQTERILLWGNASFNRASRQDGIWVAHGHTIVDPPYFGNGRISVDTGAYLGGPLTAAAVSSQGQVRFLSVR